MKKSVYINELMRVMRTGSYTKISKDESTVHNGYVLYKGDLAKDIFYALRKYNLPYIGDGITPTGKTEKVLKDAKKDKVSLTYLYSRHDGITPSDVYEIVREGFSEKYIQFNKKWGKAILDHSILPEYYIDINSFKHFGTSGLYQRNEYGELTFMPMTLDEVLVPSKLRA